MNGGDVRYSYGPVPSRRLGKSLGINNIPAKVCTYSCVYCQVGRTTQMQSDRCSFYEPEAIFRDVQNRLARTKEARERVDYLNLGREIMLLKTLKVPVGVITNSSLLWREDVREELGRADWVSLKIDAVQKAIWRRVNRFHEALSLSQVLKGIRAFARTYTGKLVTETMLVKDINDNDDCLREVADFVHGLQPSRAYLSITTRPPAERWVHGPDEVVLNRAYQIFAGKLKQVEYLIGYEGDAFASTGDVGNDLLSIAAVHPMRKEAVSAFLSRTGSTWEVVERLVAQGDVAETQYEGHQFYLRRLQENRAATT
ncbi:MAG: radical SAM protein [candidate division WOR-3 bacterium]|nr:radical SAM protein [candidate division WOR-3 bacterium]